LNKEYAQKVQEYHPTANNSVRIFFV